MPDPSAECELLPLLVGVSGHRDLRAQDLPALGEQIGQVIDTLRRDCPNTPLWLLSPLAEGADRLVAEVALARGARLIVPLPLSQAMYERDFADEASLAQFQQLLARAAEVFELPLAPGNDSIEALREYGAARDRQYAQVGAFVALHSQVLIALWDGTNSGKVGGTSQVVEFMHDGVPEPYAPPTSALYDRETGPVYHLFTRRSTDDSDANDAGRLTVLQPGNPNEVKQTAKLQRRMRQTAQRFNDDVRAYAAQLAGQRTESRNYLMDNATMMAAVGGLDAMADQFALVDSLAIQYQRRTLRTLKILLALSFVAIVLLQTYLAGAGPAVWLLPIYAGVVLFAFGYYWWTQRAGHESKYLDYRALAEGLRVQFFWRLAGIEHCVSDYYLRRQRGVLEWVRNAIRAWSLGDTMLNGHEANVSEAQRLASIQRHWVQDQAAYFARAGRRNRRQARWLSWCGHALVLLGSALAGIDAWLGGSPPLVVASIVLPITAGLICLYINRRALTEHANQYERMGKLFADVAVRLDQRLAAEDLNGCRQLIFEIGQEALAENADWLILHRDRPMETPNVA